MKRSLSQPSSAPRSPGASRKGATPTVSASHGHVRTSEAVNTLRDNLKAERAMAIELRKQLGSAEAELAKRSRSPSPGVHHVFQ